MRSASLIKHFLPWLMVLLAVVFYGYELVLRVSPSVMIPELMQSFDISKAELGTLSASYYVGYILALFFVGPIVDRYRPRKVLSVAILTCAVSTLMFSSADSLWIAQLARILMGLGSAFAFVGALKIGADWLPESRFGMVAGMTTMLGMLTVIFGLRALSYAIETVSWRGLLQNIAYIGVALLLLFYFVCRDRCYPSSDGETALKPHTENLMRRPELWVLGVIGMTTYLPVAAFSELWGIHYLEEVYGLPRSVAADAIGIVFMGWVFGGPVFGWFSDRLRDWRSALFFGTGMAFLFMSLVLYAQLNFFLLKVALFGMGFCASSHVLVFVGCRAMTDKRHEATAFAFTNVLTSMSGLFFQPLMGWLLDIFGRLQIFDAERTGFYVTYGLIPVALLITLWLLLKLSAKPRSSSRMITEDDVILELC